ILGRKYSLSGQFSTLGQLGVVVARSGFSSISVILQLDLTGTTNFMTGQLSDGAWTAQLIANRSVYSVTNPPPLAGKKYTLLFPGPPDSLTEPGGDGFGTVTIDKAGNVIFSGKLGDGSAIRRKHFSLVTANGRSM